MSDKNQRLVLSILDFLSSSIENGTVKADDQEGLEVAIQCIGEAFGVDPNDAAQRESLSIKPASLQTIFDVYLRTSSKVKSPTAAPGAAPASTSTAPAASTSSPAIPTPEDKKAADALKAQGNAHMSSRDYDKAIESYTKAVALDPTNPVYYSNRAAAHSSAEDHDNAIDDAKKAAELDPSFIKAYSRLGHAYYSKEDYESAVTAFEDGLKIDPTNANLRTNLENAKARLPTVSSPAAPTPRGGAGGMPDLSALLGGAGGGGAGGMPDLASLMNNPAIMQMAQNMMANGGLEQLMQNPAMRNMAENFNRGGGMPSMEEMMNNPELANMARNFMGGRPPGQ